MGKNNKSSKISLSMLLVIALTFIGQMAVPKPESELHAINKAEIVNSGELVPKIHMHYVKNNGYYVDAIVGVHKYYRKDTGNAVFCVEPGVKSAHGIKTGVDATEVVLDGSFFYVENGDLGTKKISQAELEQLKLFIYYAWDESAQTIDDYAATQAYIWSYLWNGTITGYDSGGKIVLENKINKALSLVKNHAVLPNLSGKAYDPTSKTLTLKAGETIVLTDKNNVIGTSAGKERLLANTSGTKVEIKNGSLAISAVESSVSGQIKFKKVTKTKANQASLVWVDGKTQKMLDVNDPVKQEFNLNVKVIKNGKLALTKQGDKGELLDGASFQLRNKQGQIIKLKKLAEGRYMVDPSGTDSFTTSAGQALIEELAENEYTLIELVAPKGYKIKAKTSNIKINAGQTTNINLVNTIIKAPVTIQKYDVINALDNPRETSLAGAEFELKAQELENPENTPYKVGEVIEVLATDNNGVAKSKDLYLGTYELKETAAPKGYKLNPGIVTFKLTEENGQVKITQTTYNHDSALGEMNQAIQAFNTIIKEQNVRREPLARVENNKPQNVSKDTILFADRNIYGRVEINKVLGEFHHETGSPKQAEADIKFNILDSAGNVVDTIISNESGYASSKWLPYGNYTLRQLSESEESYKVNDLNFAIDAGNDLQKLTYQLENEQVVSRLKLVKKDKDTGRQIAQANVSFEIFGKDGRKVEQTIYYPEKRTISLFKTNSKGEVELPEPLTAGEYYIKEVDFPKNYVVSDTKIEFSINRTKTEENGGLLVIEVDNAPAKAQIVIDKQGEQVIGFTSENFVYAGKKYEYVKPIIENQALAGVEFHLIAQEDIYVPDNTLAYHKGELVEVLKTDDAGKATSEYLPFGKYILRETKTPAGYALAKDMFIELNHEEASKEIILKAINVNNQLQTAKVKVSKEFTQSKDFGKYENAYQKVVFALVTSEDMDFAGVKLEKGSIVAVSNLTKNYQLEFTDVLPGKYEVKELCTSNEYKLAETKEFLFKPDNQTEVTFPLELEPILNELKEYEIEVTKIDKDSGRKIEDVYFMLYVETPQGNREVARAKTDKNGVARFTNLNAGVYYLKELKTKAEYILSPEIFVIDTNNAGEVIKLEVANELTKTQISKTDISGQEIAGAKLEVIDKSGKVIESWTSKAGKTHIIRGLHRGEKYILRETLAPAGYAKSQDIEFEINTDGSLTKVQMINELLPAKTGASITPLLATIVIITALILLAVCRFILLRKRKEK